MSRTTKNLVYVNANVTLLFFPLATGFAGFGRVRCCKMLLSPFFTRPELEFVNGQQLVVADPTSPMSLVIIVSLKSSPDVDC